MIEPHFHFAGWFSLDVRVLLAMTLFAGSLATFVLAMWGKQRRWDEHVVGFVAVFLIGFAAAWFVTDAAGAPTPVQVETVFPVP